MLIRSNDYSSILSKKILHQKYCVQNIVSKILNIASVSGPPSEEKISERSCFVNKDISQRKRHLKLVNASYLFTLSSYLEKTYTITAQEPSIYAIVPLNIKIFA